MQLHGLVENGKNWSFIFLYKYMIGLSVRSYKSKLLENYSPILEAIADKTGTNTNSAFSITSPKRMVNNTQQPTQTTNGLGCWGHHCLGSKNWQ